MPKDDSPYTKELLDEILKDGEATLIGNYEKLNQRMAIEFACKCGEKVSKKFEMLRLYRQAYCKDCSIVEMKKKIINTCISKYGVENGSMTQESKDKQKKTYLEKYGDHPKRTKKVHEKWVKTCLEKYGGHPNQNKEVQEKSESSSYKFKEYKMPSGKIVKYQGYENLAIDELFERGYYEDDIVIGRGSVPLIKYQIDDINHVYFPDMYLKSENKIIEIKSE